MKFVEKEDVLKQFNDLLPWEKVDVLDKILNEMGENSIEDYLFNNGGYSPFDFTNATQCVDHYGADTLLEEMYDYDIEDYIQAHPSICSAYCYITALEKKWNWHKKNAISDTNIKALEDLLQEIKSEKMDKK